MRTVLQSSYWVALCWENQDFLYSTVFHLLWEWRFLMKFSPSVYSVPSVQWTGLLSIGNSNLVHSFSWGVVIYCCILFTMLVFMLNNWLFIWCLNGTLVTISEAINFHKPWFPQSPFNSGFVAPYGKEHCDTLHGQKFVDTLTPHLLDEHFKTICINR